MMRILVRCSLATTALVLCMASLMNVSTRRRKLPPVHVDGPKAATRSSTNSTRARGKEWSSSRGVAGRILWEEKSETTSDDGCGSDGNPEWIPYNKIDSIRLWSVQQCLMRVDDSKYPEGREVHAMNRHAHTKLKCRRSIVQSELLSILGLFRNITFFGDWNMYHQVLSLFCMLDPFLYAQPEESPPVRAHRPGYYLYELHNPSRNHTTHIRYVPFAHNWGPKVRLAFQERIDRTIEEFGSDDAIVMNGGLHHVLHHESMALDRFDNFVDTVREIVEKARSPVYFMETAHEEWPTSNGNPSKNCGIEDDENPHVCECEMLSEERLQGRGPFIEQAKRDISQLTVDQKDLLKLLPGDYSTLYSNDNRDCVPNCLPASWRNDFVASRFQRTSGRLRIVSIFRQLVAQNKLQSRSLVDCSHKSSATLIEMNKQLLRAMDEDATVAGRQNRNLSY